MPIHRVDIRVSPPTSLSWPPIDRLPSDFDPDALAPFTASTRRWDREQEPVPSPAPFLFWALGVANLLLGGWAGATLLGSVSCTTVLCSVVLLDDHPRLLLVLAVACVLALTAAAVPTGGFARADGYQLGLLALAAVTGGSALIGVAVVVVGLAFAALVVGGLVFSLVEND